RPHACAHGPDQRHEAIVEFQYPISNLGKRNEHLAGRVGVESSIARIAHDPDDLPRRFGERRSHPAADRDPLSERLSMRPEPARHGFVYDHHARCSGGIAISEAAPAGDLHLEYIEEARRHIVPDRAAPGLLGVWRPALNLKSETQTAVERQI